MAAYSGMKQITAGKNVIFYSARRQSLALPEIAHPPASPSVPKPKAAPVSTAPAETKVTARALIPVMAA